MHRLLFCLVLLSCLLVAFHPQSSAAGETVQAVRGAASSESLPTGTATSLPPDPGEAGKATLAGLDSDGDGIRDDVQRYIALEYPDSAKTRKAMTQLAVPLQDFILHSQDKEAVMNSASALGRGIDCLYYVRPDEAYDMGGGLESIVFNTEDRIRAYIAASAFLGGETFQAAPLEEEKNMCNFNPDELAN